MHYEAVSSNGSEVYMTIRMDLESVELSKIKKENEIYSTIEVNLKPWHIEEQHALCKRIDIKHFRMIGWKGKRKGEWE